MGLSKSKESYDVASLSSKIDRENAFGSVRGSGKNQFLNFSSDKKKDVEVLNKNETDLSKIIADTLQIPPKKSESVENLKQERKKSKTVTKVDAGVNVCLENTSENLKTPVKKFSEASISGISNENQSVFSVNEVIEKFERKSLEDPSFLRYNKFSQTTDQTSPKDYFKQNENINKTICGVEKVNKESPVSNKQSGNVEINTNKKENVGDVKSSEQESAVDNSSEKPCEKENHKVKAEINERENSEAAKRFSTALNEIEKDRSDFVQEMLQEQPKESAEKTCNPQVKDVKNEDNIESCPADEEILQVLHIPPPSKQEHIKQNPSKKTEKINAVICDLELIKGVETEITTGYIDPIENGKFDIKPQHIEIIYSDITEVITRTGYNGEDCGNLENNLRPTSLEHELNNGVRNYEEVLDKEESRESICTSPTSIIEKCFSGIEDIANKGSKINGIEPLSSNTTQKNNTKAKIDPLDQKEPTEKQKPIENPQNDDSLCEIQEIMNRDFDKIETIVHKNPSNTSTFITFKPVESKSQEKSSKYPTTPSPSPTSISSDNQDYPMNLVTTTKPKTAYERTEEKQMALNTIQEIQYDADKLKSAVLDFEGIKNDVQYVYLNEMLLRCLIKLDSIGVGGDEDIREQKKKVTEYVQDCIKELDSKAEGEESDFQVAF